MTGLIIGGALFLTILTFACVWATTDAVDDYNEQRRRDEDD